MKKSYSKSSKPLKHVCQNKKQSSGQLTLLQHLQRNSQMKSIRASAKGQSLRNLKIISLIYYFTAFEIHSVLVWNQNFSTESHSKTQQHRWGKIQPSATNCKRMLESPNVPFRLFPAEFDYQHIQSVGTRPHSVTHGQRWQHSNSLAHGYTTSDTSAAVTWGPPHPKLLAFRQDNSSDT